MRIPNKFNGYMSDGRRLYPDPATSAIIASSLASGTAAAGTTAAATAAAAAAAPTLTAAAVPGIVGSAAPVLTGAAAPAATTALGAELGTTAALEASKQGIIQAGAQQAGAEAAKQAGVEAAKQVAQEGVKEGIMTGAKDAAALGMDQVGAANASLDTLKANAIQGAYPPVTPPVAPPVAAAPPAAPPGVPNAPYDLTSKAVPDIATKPIDQIASTSLPQPSLPSTNIADGANVAKDVVGNPNLKVGAEQLATKTPPNALERGFSAAKQMAGDVSKFAKENPLLTTGGIMLAQNMMQPSNSGGPPKKDYRNKQGNNFEYREPSSGTYTPIFEPTPYAVGGPVEQMSAENAIGGNMMYPQSQLNTSMYSSPMVQRPMPSNVIGSGIDAPVNTYTGEPRMADGGKVSAFERMMKEEEARKKREDAQARADLEEGKSVASKTKPYSRTQSTNSPYAAAIKEFQSLNKKYGIPVAAPAKTNMDLMGDQDQIEYAANGGIMHGLGGYSDGGRLLKGPGDGVSDSIPAVIGRKQPARLADGEFVIPARIVSELGNGSTEAGARKLYAMMERIQKQRGKTVGKGKVAVNSKADKHLPA